MLPVVESYRCINRQYVMGRYSFGGKTAEMAGQWIVGPGCDNSTAGIKEAL